MTMDDPSEDIFAQLEEEMGEVDTSDVIDMTKLSIPELLVIYGEETEDLMDEGQAMNPRTQEARDKHSLRYAARIELQRRQNLL
jgi:hypothetical protein